MKRIFRVSLRLLRVAHGQVTFLYQVYYLPKVLKRVLLYGTGTFMPNLWKGGATCLQVFMHGSECWEWHTKTPPLQLPTTDYQEMPTWNEIQRSQSRYMCAASC